MGFKLNVCVLALSVFAGYIVYTTPTWPPTASHRWLKYLTGTYLRFMAFMMHVGPYLGLGEPFNITRVMFEVPALVLDVGASSAVETEKTVMDGVEVMIFRPRSRSGLLPGIMLFHGGGWVLGTPDTYAPVSRQIVETTHSVLVSVNYRRAPENPFPIPYEDCLRVTKFLMKNAEKYGIDKDKIGVKGDSAGGNIAMAVALTLSKDPDPALPKLAFMGLNYAVLQMFDYSLPSYRKHGEGPGLCTKEIAIKYALLYAFGNFSFYEIFRDNKHVSKHLVESSFPSYVSPKLLPKHIQEKDKDFLNSNEKDENLNHWTGGENVPSEITDMITDWRYAPLMAPDDDLKLLPPTYIMNAEFDVLRDEGLILAERLRRVDNTVEHSYYVSEQHGFLNLFRLNHYGYDEILSFARFFNKTIRPYFVIH